MAGDARARIGAQRLGERIGEIEGTRGVERLGDAVVVPIRCECGAFLGYLLIDIAPDPATTYREQEAP